MGVLKGKLDHRKEVAVKFGPPHVLQKEFTLGETLQDVPNYMRFFCSFTCNESAQNIYRQRFATHPYVCSGPGGALGLVVMPFYPLGSLNQCAWDRSNLHVLQNVLLQICFATIRAYEVHGFVHGDLHLDNVLVRKTKRAELWYGSKRLAIQGGLYVVIMDFERSTLDDPKDRPQTVYHAMHKVLTLACCMEGNSDLAMAFDHHKVCAWISQNAPITPATYDALEEVVAGMHILYEKSRRPPNPFA